MKSVGEFAETERALLNLLIRLKRENYTFVAPSPASHAIVLARHGGFGAPDIRDVLGWSLPFEPGTVDAEIEALLKQAGALAIERDKVRATIRVSSLRDHLYIHSAYPTVEADAVFFGPDSYRFANLLQQELRGDLCGKTIVDVGTGSGVGAIVAASIAPGARIVATDINPTALRYARINAQAAGVELVCVEGDLLGDYVGELDIAIANPPYIIDAAQRQYRDGGALHGAELSLRMTETILPRLKPNGQFILYTGSAIVAGVDEFKLRAEAIARSSNCTTTYHEIDPDVFGEELASPAYADVERIAVVGAVFTHLADHAV